MNVQAADHPYDLRMGYPHLGIVPRERLTELTAKLYTRDIPLQYADDMIGDIWTREQIAHWLTDVAGQPVSADELHLTGGAIAGTDMICRYLTQPGDIVLVEDPTFYYIIHKLELSHVQVVGVPMTPSGVDLDALESLCKEHGVRVKMLYSIPAYQNPTGYTYTDATRHRLIELAHQYDFRIVEDATYQLLYYKDAPPNFLRTYDPDGDRVLTTASFSKLIMPALCIGYIWGTPQQTNDLLPYKSTAPGVFMGQVVGEMIASGEIGPHTESVQSFYGHKHDLMTDTLAEHAPDWFEYITPNGGFFVWATLPEGLTATEVLEAAQARGVDFALGTRAFVADAPDRTMRLCFAMRDDDVVETGTRVLCEVLQDMRVGV